MRVIIKKPLGMPYGWGVMRATIKAKGLKPLGWGLKVRQGIIIPYKKYRAFGGAFGVKCPLECSYRQIVLLFSFRFFRISFLPIVR
ncbi:hypothetical protein [Helicobacter enhydrae]|uniref:hypothetical protein n=1 Tax=Helicobacter enhydrae TaxID=222136 RepID=UPI0018FF4263|nr:hypothetical protein [Helicobacter enhydrae]